MVLTESVKVLLMETAHTLKGSERRRFMAQTVQALGPGGALRAEQELGWNRGLIRKGSHELATGLTCQDAFAARGRFRAEAHLPHLLHDLRALFDGQSQADPKFQTNRLYTRVSAAEVRRQLIAQKKYTDQELPTARTLATKLNDLGYYLGPVAQSQPQKKPPQTDAIFDQIHHVNAAADADEQTLRLSLDAKATVKIGPFSRGGHTRVRVVAVDHDFHPEALLNLWGLFLPQYEDLFLFFTPGRITSDFIGDRLGPWWSTVQARFPQVQTVVINQDNGPENHSRRTPFLKRMVDFAAQFHVTVRLAYYPPYHSKYNPIERVWGILENHGNGSLLDTVDTAFQFAQSMTWHGKHPVVQMVKTLYPSGVRLTPSAMKDLEKQVTRFPTLEKWFVDIPPPRTPVEGNVG